MGKLLKSPYFKVIAVFCVVLIVLLITTAIAGSFNSLAVSVDDEAMIIQGSFIYAAEYLNPYEEIIEESYFNGDFFNEPSVVIQNSAFVANNSPAVVSLFLASEQRSGIITYEVQPGDIPSEIASMFGITTNTVLWANNLSAWSKIKAGQKLVILPVSGVRHTVKQGETLEAIVKKYKGETETTIALNGLPANGSLAIGKEIIIPDGQKPVEYVPRANTYASYTPEELGPYGDTSHGFPWGHCTWYVAQKKYIPWNGDAKTWLVKAKQYGFGTGTEPKTGAIVVTRESVYGHVAYIESVGENTITVSEMSLGRGIKRIRILDQTDWRIRGYIY